MHYYALIALHLVYFITFSVVGFLPKYFGEIGLSNSQIGMLMSLPAVVGVLCQPYFGVLVDRARYKRMALTGLLAALGVTCFAMNGVSGFLPLIAGLTVFSVMELPVAPTLAAISLEYTQQVGKSYGLIRLVGTVGYQIGALLTGALLVGSLHGIYRLLGLVMVFSCAITFLLPTVKGHQYGRKKVPMAALLRDRHILALLAMVLIGTVTTQFYLSFFTRHMGNLGVDNTVTGLMLFVSVILELPILLRGDRLAQKTSIWNWLLIGYGLNAIRWMGLAATSSVPLLMLFQIPAVSVMLCFEFLPAIYVSRRVPDELKGSAQSALMVVAFGVSKVIGSLIGGFASERVGIPTVFAFNGVMLGVAILALWEPTRRLIQSEMRVSKSAGI